MQIYFFKNQRRLPDNFFFFLPMIQSNFQLNKHVTSYKPTITNSEGSFTNSSPQWNISHPEIHSETPQHPRRSKRMHGKIKTEPNKWPDEGFDGSDGKQRPNPHVYTRTQSRQQLTTDRLQKVRKNFIVWSNRNKHVKWTKAVTSRQGAVGVTQILSSKSTHSQHAKTKTCSHQILIKVSLTDFSSNKRILSVTDLTIWYIPPDISSFR